MASRVAIGRSRGISCVWWVRLRGAEFYRQIQRGPQPARSSLRRSIREGWAHRSPDALAFGRKCCRGPQAGACDKETFISQGVVGASCDSAGPRAVSSANCWLSKASCFFWEPTWVFSSGNCLLCNQLCYEVPRFLRSALARPHAPARRQKPLLPIASKRSPGLTAG